MEVAAAAGAGDGGRARRSDKPDAELEAAVGRAIVQSLEAYYGVLRAEAALHLAELALEEATLRAEEIAARRLEGTATAVDELQVEAERLQAEARVIQAHGEAAASRMGLNQALGFPTDTRLNVVEMDIPAAWPALEEALQLAARRADVQRAPTIWRRPAPPRSSPASRLPWGCGCSANIAGPTRNCRPASIVKDTWAVRLPTTGSIWRTKRSRARRRAGPLASR